MSALLSPNGRLPPTIDDYSSPSTTYTPNRLPVKKTPVTMWDLMALQDVYVAQLEAESEHTRKTAQMKEVQKFQEYQRSLKTQFDKNLSKSKHSEGFQLLKHSLLTGDLDRKAEEQRRRQKIEVSRENLRRSVRMREAMFKSRKEEKEALR